ncbi:MAG TPA: c-type cytochrome domain-containing protein, partial [Gammaproteobacteria bacterium]|nr:c-type cytochrome domain-containing protein [Gammaproteobacteria bacterium]
MLTLRVSNRVMLYVFLAITGFFPFGVYAQDQVSLGAEFFSHEIRPIMERTCWNCHSDQIQSSGLDLSSRDAALAGGSRGPAIVPGNADESRLFRQISGLEGPLMPLGVTLSDNEIEAVRTWINDGAEWDAQAATAVAGESYTAFATDVPDSAREYWAFKLPVNHPLPEVANFNHPIDRFLEQQRLDSGVTAAPKADRLTLLRRAYLDLIGL